MNKTFSTSQIVYNINIIFYKLYYNQPLRFMEKILNIMKKFKNSLNRMIKDTLKLISINPKTHGKINMIYE